MRWRDRRRPRRCADGPERVTRDRIIAVLVDREKITMDFQPILDIRNARTAGWEVLARIGGRDGPGPDAWLTSAYQLGLGLELEIATLRRVIAGMRMRIPGTFMSVAVTPAAVDDRGIHQVFAANAPLDGLLVEVRSAAGSLGSWEAFGSQLRAMGAKVAIEVAAAGLDWRQMLALRPDVVKIDQTVIEALDHDPLRRALLQHLGSFAAQLDAWLLAEGVHSPGQLAALRSLGVPLAQGWLIGPPTPVPTPCSPQVTTAGQPISAMNLSRCGGRRAGCDVQTRIGAAASTPARGMVAAGATVGQAMQPRTGPRARPNAALRVTTDLPLAEAARRAMTRTVQQRFDVLECVDDAGAVVGELPVDLLVLALAGDR